MRFPLSKCWDKTGLCCFFLHGLQFIAHSHCTIWVSFFLII
jgi:hypothetical protein